MDIIVVHHFPVKLIAINHNNKKKKTNISETMKILM